MRLTFVHDDDNLLAKYAVHGGCGVTGVEIQLVAQW